MHVQYIQCRLRAALLFSHLKKVDAAAEMFSTANVDAAWKSLWKTRTPGCAINHLARSGKCLRNKCAHFSTAIVESVR
jgi:hypothetical protein